MGFTNNLVHLLSIKINMKAQNQTDAITGLRYD